MTEKHIDLIETLNREVKGGGSKEGIFPMRGSDFDNDRRVVLRWLDAHPDQVPGRTITESRIAEAFGPEYMAWARMCLSRIGITVIPDPKPTNAERLAAKIRRTLRENATGSCENAQDVVAQKIADDLDNAGVKAPEADDD